MMIIIKEYRDKINILIQELDDYFNQIIKILSTIKTEGAIPLWYHDHISSTIYTYKTPYCFINEVKRKTGITIIQNKTNKINFIPTTISKEICIKNYLKQRFIGSSPNSFLSTILAINNTAFCDWDTRTIANIACTISDSKYPWISNSSRSIKERDVIRYLEKILNIELAKPPTKNLIKYYLYKYVDIDNNIVYIGKSTNLYNRIQQHKSDKLKNFQGNIYYIYLQNKTEMDFLEYVLINKYHPKNNIQYKNPLIQTTWDNEPEWILYEEPINEN